MHRFTHTLSLLLTLSLFLASCRPQTADRRPQADGGRLTVDGGQPTVSSPAPTLTPTPQPTPTETPIPQPSLESLGLSAETQALLNRQGWDIAWDAQNARYLIRQRAFDEASQTFTSQLTHEVGYIDLEGNLHFTATYFSAQENEDGTWKDASTTQDIVIDLKNIPQSPDLIIKQQLDENGNPISFQEKLKTPGFHLLETKNPAFEKTGILTLTYLDENGAPQTIFYNPELGFLPKTEISTDIDHPTFLPWEAIHSRFPPHVQLLILDGYDQPFVYPEGEKFEGWRIQFIYDQKTQSKMAFLRPTNGHSQQWVLNEQQQPVWFVTYAPDGSRHQMSVVRIHNPKDPAQPAADETMFLLASWGEWMNKRPLNYRNGFKHTYLNMQERPRDYYFTHFVPYVVIATENGYLEKSPWGNFPGRPSLDSLLGMEKTKIEAMEYGGVYTIGPFKNEYDYMKANNLTVDEILIAVDINGVTKYVPLPILLQMVVLVISP
jgi:hypothetical protein